MIKNRVWGYFSIIKFYIMLSLVLLSAQLIFSAIHHDLPLIAIRI
ncbi:MAG: hypothetical protein ACMUIA_00940 [bacterium]